MLLTYITELADEPLALTPDRRDEETEVNTWWLSSDDEDLRSLTVAEVVAAFEATAAALRRRVAESGYAGPATFYVRHDRQAGQLRTSTGTVGPAELPFGGRYRPTADLAPVVAGYLADADPGSARREDPVEVGPDDLEPDPEPEPFPVWVSALGDTGAPGVLGGGDASADGRG
ncbi:hypothetical protein ACIQBJ_04000 [Kitasatospora sp. NPDC088391]|uniref:hypothetical protein n=1 Tax=Kitasatospora sp. NPDC088391 TaxID=3364074 RepID=UPI00381C9355